MVAIAALSALKSSVACLAFVAATFSASLSLATPVASLPAPEAADLVPVASACAPSPILPTPPTNAPVPSLSLPSPRLTAETPSASFPAPLAALACTASETFSRTAASTWSCTSLVASARLSSTCDLILSVIGPHIWVMIAWFSGALATAGSSAASRASVSTCSSASELVTLTGRMLNSSDSMIAVPMVPPIWRKNVAELVATPMSRASADACAAMVRVCINWPSPRPITNMAIIKNHSGLSTLMKVRIPKPTAVVPVPVIGKIAYLPVRAISWPEPIEASIRPAIMGSVAKPDWVGVRPVTICR